MTRIQTLDRWAARVELGSDVLDFAGTLLALSTPEYRTGTSYPVQELFFLVPREAGYGKYLLGDRSRVGVGMFLTAGGAAEHWGLPWVSHKIDNYSLSKRGWRRHVLPLVVPGVRVALIVGHLQGGIGQIGYRNHYLNYLDKVGLPHHVPGGAVPFP